MTNDTLIGTLRDISAGTYIDRVILDYPEGVVRATWFHDTIRMFTTGWLLESTNWKYTPEHLYVYHATYVRKHG